MQVRGQAEVGLRNLWMEGGVEGIDWEGRGRIVLHDTTINNNRDIGVRVEGHDGTARLELLGGNVISHNSNGVRLASAVYESESNGSAMFVRGPDNRIVQNRGFGIEVLPGATSMPTESSSRRMRGTASSGHLARHGAPCEPALFVEPGCAGDH